MAVSWRFDGDDRLCGVGADWDDFALANDGRACVPPPIGRGLAELITSAELCVVWKAIFGLTRREHDRAVTLTYRCDSPGSRRVMKATVTSSPHHEIDIVSAIERLEARPVMHLLEPAADDRGAEMMRMCGWCARIMVDGWVDVEEGCRRLGLLELETARLPRITHGICDACKDAIAGDLDLSPGFLPHNRHHVPARDPGRLGVGGKAGT